MIDVAGSARRITVEFIGNDRSLGSTANSLGGQTSRLGDKLKSFGKVAAAGLAVAAAGIVAWGASSVTSLARIERINAQTEQAIKSTGGAAGVSAKHVEELAGSLENLTATEAETTQEGANLLLTFTNIKNGVGESNQIFDRTTAIMTDMSRALGQDTKSSAIQLGKALNDPVKGITALSRVGVSFTDQQKETIKALVETGDTMGAQKVILKELTKEFGGSGAAFAKTTEGQIELAKHAFGTLGETIFARLLPPLGKLAGAATKGLAWADEKMPAVEAFARTMSDRLRPAMDRTSTASARVGQFVRTQLMPAFQKFNEFIATKVFPIVSGLAKFYVTKFVPAMARVWAQVATKLKPIFDELVKTFRAKVLPTLERLLDKFEEHRPTIQKVILAVAKVTGKLLIFQAAILGKVLPPLIRLTGWLVGKLVPGIGSNIRMFALIIGKAIDFGRAVHSAGERVGRFAQAVARGISTALGHVRDAPGKAARALGNLSRTLYNAGVSLMSGFAEGIKDKIGDAIDAVQEGLGKIKGLLPGSPIKWGPLKAWNDRSPGKRLMGLVADGIREGGPGVSSAGVAAMSGLASPPAGGPSVGRGHGLRGGGGGVTVIVNGALDPVAVGRQIEQVLVRYQRSQNRTLAFRAAT